MLETKLSRRPCELLQQYNDTYQVFRVNEASNKFLNCHTEPIEATKKLFRLLDSDFKPALNQNLLPLRSLSINELLNMRLENFQDENFLLIPQRTAE